MGLGDRLDAILIVAALGHLEDSTIYFVWIENPMKQVII